MEQAMKTPNMTPAGRTPHTPTPYASKRAGYATDGEYDHCIYAEIDGKRRVIAEVFGRVSEDCRPDAEANAAFIVRACNAHDELVEALEELREQCKGVAPFANAVATSASVKDIRRVGKFMAACDKADAALQRAKE